MDFKKVIKQYIKLEKPILLIILTEFFIQFINITFMNIQPLFMETAHYTKNEIAQLTATRFAGVLLFAIPLGIWIKGKKVKIFFTLSACFVPLFALLTIYFTSTHDVLWIHVSQFLWGASFTFMQIPIIPFILRNCKIEHHTSGIALSYSTYSFAGIISGILVSILDLINPILFDERMILIIFSISGFSGIWIMMKVQLTEKTTEKKHAQKKQYDWFLITKALIPSVIIAVGAGLTIPFISLFFSEVHHFDKGDFSIVSSVGAIFVAIAALMVPEIKKNIGYKIAIPGTQTLAIISLVALATTQYYNQINISAIIAVICYLLRQPLMNVAAPMTTELVMKYVGKKNQEMVSALMAAIWNGSYFISGLFVALLFANGIEFVNIFLITAALYAIGVLWYYFLIIDYNKRETLGLIEKDV
jgi:MFS family permease